jgi:glycosyltransferase involved in cell wall biosynthesis
MIQKRVSVILPVKNGQQYIAQALSSIERNCGPEDEILIINDDSTDDTLSIIDSFVNSFNLIVINGLSLGPSRGRNLGLQRACGRYITFLDHDDEWPLGRLDAHLRILESDMTTDIAMGLIQNFSGPSSNQPSELISDPIFHVHLGASTFRRTVFDKIGIFDESLTFSEDHDLFLRIREAGLSIKPVDEIGLYYRIHESNMTRQKPLNEMQVFEVIKRSLKRRKITGKSLSPFPSNRQIKGH